MGWIRGLLAVIAALALWLGVTVEIAVPTLRAQQAEGDEESADLGIPHVECSLFGDERDQFLKASLGTDLALMTQHSELTTSVVAALSGSGRMSPGRVGSQGSGNTTIDSAIFGMLASRNIPAAPGTSDAEFLRRVTLDLTGRIPTVDEVVAFLNDPSLAKRGNAIDRLLDTPQWADRWAMFLGDLYRNTIVTAQVNRYIDGRDAFHLFLRDSLRENKPYDRMAREMISASGNNDGRYWPAEFASYEQYVQMVDDYENNPVTPTAASYMVGGRVTGGPIHDTYDGMAVNLARDFLGLGHMDCILCHDGVGHLDSLSVWGAQAKRLDGWQLAAFFSDTALLRPPRVPAPSDGGVGPMPRWWIVAEPERDRLYRLNTSTGNRPPRMPTDAGGMTVVTPVYPFGGGTPSAGEDYREAVARLLTQDPQFARAIVNYVWKEFFSRGLVEPVDQFDLARLDPASPPPQPWELQSPHVALLNQLAQSFADNGFDLQWLMREITRSRAYQLSSRYEGAWNPTYEPYFARHQVRRLRAEELHDALVISSGIVQPYLVSPALGAVVLAMQFPDVQFVPLSGRRDTGPNAAATSFLDAFLRGDREQTARSAEATILQALNLMNSPLVLDRVKASQQTGSLAQILQQPDDTAVQSLYLVVLNRPPTPSELTAGVQLLAGGDRAQKAEDLMWALYNKVDLIFNY